MGVFKKMYKDKERLKSEEEARSALIDFGIPINLIDSGFHYPKGYIIYFGTHGFTIWKRKPFIEMFHSFIERRNIFKITNIGGKPNSSQD